MIEVAPTAPRMSFNEAILYCQFCDHGGLTDWRLPTFNECVELGISGWYLNDPANGQYTVVPVRDV